MERVAVGRTGRQLAGQGVSWQDRASVGMVGQRLAAYDASWQDRAAVGRMGGGEGGRFKGLVFGS